MLGLIRIHISSEDYDPTDKIKALEIAFRKINWHLELYIKKMEANFEEQLNVYKESKSHCIKGREI